MNNEDSSDSAPDRPKPTALQILWSMIAAFCGIQNNDNHDRDDSYIDQVGFMPYIIAGIALTLFFMALIWVVVMLIV